MKFKPPGFEQPKWDALKSALVGALDGSKSQLDVGLALYPDAPPGDASPAAGCTMPTGTSAIVVALAAGSTSVPLISQQLDTAQPAGGTPTTEALAQALEYFKNGPGKDLEEEKYILLATDGGPNCNGDLSCEASMCTLNLDGLCPAEAGNCCAPEFDGAIQCLDQTAAVSAVTALSDIGVKTIVVGLPGTEAAPYVSTLNSMAVAGKAPQVGGDVSFYPVDSDGGADGLSALLSRLTRELVTTCTLELTEDPPDPAKVNVKVDGELIPQAGDNGWDLALDETPARVILKGATCQKVEQQGAESIEMVYGCPTVVVN